MSGATQRWVAFGVALGLLGISALGMGTVQRVFAVHLQKEAIYPPGGRVLASLPRETPRWSALGSDRVESPDVVKVLGTSNYLTRLYAREEGQAEAPRVVLDLHCAYYTGMIDTVPHVPERCFVGGGLQQADFAQVHDVPLDASAWRRDESVPPELAGEGGAIYTLRLPYHERSSAPGQRVRLPRGVTPERPLRMRISSFDFPDGRRLYAGYFFIANGGTAANARQVQALAFDLTSDYAYFLKVQITSSSVGSPEELARHAGSLLDDLLGEILMCVPDWVEVEQGRYPPDNPRRDGA